MVDKTPEYSTVAKIESRRKVAERFTRIREKEGICPGQMSHDGRAYCTQSRFNPALLCPETSAEQVLVPDSRGSAIFYHACNYRGQKIRIK